MLWLSPLLAAVSGGLVLFYVLAYRRILEALRVKWLADDEDDAEEDAAALNARNLADNLPLLRLHLAEDATASGYRRQAEAVAGQRAKRLNTEGLVNNLGEAGSTLLILAFVMSVGYFTEGVEHGALARYAVFILVLRRVLQPLKALQRMPGQWNKLRAQLTEADMLLHGDGQPRIQGGTRPVSPCPAEIDIRGLDFAYPGRPPLLRGFHCVLRRGTLHVLAGPNGCGKSTVLKLLLRLYDVPPGTIFLDGHDLRDYDLPTLRRRTGYVHSEPLLLNDSLRSNLTLGLEDEKAGDPALWQALERVGLGSWARALESGLDHTIGDRGMRLSQGQRQKLALARTLLHDPGILLLDEAWTSVDASSEAELIPLLSQLAAERIVIKVTHQLDKLPPGSHVVRMEAAAVTPDAAPDA